MQGRNVIIAVGMIFLLFFFLAPVIGADTVNFWYVPVGLQYDCPPGSGIQGLPYIPTVSLSYALFKVGMIYDPQLHPAMAFQIGPTIHLPCNRPA